MHFGCRVLQSLQYSYKKLWGKCLEKIVAIGTNISTDIVDIIFTHYIDALRS